MAKRNTKNKMSQKNRQRALLDLAAPKLMLRKQITVPITKITSSSPKKISYFDKLIYGELYTLFNVSNKLQLNKVALTKPISQSNSKRSITSFLKKLQKMKLIKISNVYENGKTLIGQVIFNTGLNQSALAVGKAFSNTDLERKKQHHAVKKPVIDMTKRVIGYLDKKINKSYRPSTPKYQRMVKNRMTKNHATFADFKKIIDNKVNDWYGTAWAKFLQPTTLLRAAHYDEYLNENTNNDRVKRLKVLQVWAKEAKEILKYFNYKLHTAYHNTGNIKTAIYKDLKAGYTVDNFKSVLDHKVRDWMDTKMEKWLIPTTVFSPDHFDIYLNEHPKTQNNSDLDDGGDFGNVNW